MVILSHLANNERIEPVIKRFLAQTNKFAAYVVLNDSQSKSSDTKNCPLNNIDANIWKRDIF